MRIVVDRDALLIGRVKADVEIDSPDVSRRHAVIERKDGVYVVRDLGSTNGTYVNGQRIDEAPLSNGDRVVVGQTVMVFHSGLEGEGVYLILALAPTGESASSKESQARLLQAWARALDGSFPGLERDTLSSKATGRSLAIFPFDDSLVGGERQHLVTRVLGFPTSFGRNLAGVVGSDDDQARIAMAVGPARRVVQDGASKLTGAIIQRISGLFNVSEMPPDSGVADEDSLRRLLAPEPGEPLLESLAPLGFVTRTDPAVPGALVFLSSEDAVSPAEQMEELCIKARVGLEAEIAAALAAPQTRNKKLAAKLAKAGGSMRVRSRLYEGLLPSPIFLTQDLLLLWIRHLDDGGRTLGKLEAIRDRFTDDQLEVVSYGLRLLGAAFHGMGGLRDLDLKQMTGAASRYLGSTLPEAIADTAHPLSQVLVVYAAAKDKPRDEATPVNLFEFLVLLALIRALRTRSEEGDIDKAKALLDSLRIYGKLWSQMLSPES